MWVSVGCACACRPGFHVRACEGRIVVFVGTPWQSLPPCMELRTAFRGSVPATWKKRVLAPEPPLYGIALRPRGPTAAPGAAESGGLAHCPHPAGSPWAAPACPGFDLCGNRFPWLGGVPTPFNLGLDFSWKTSRPKLHAARTGCAESAGCTAAFELIWLFWLFVE